jgi:hypothetical protein
MLPIMQQRDFIEREMRWLIPLGVAHLQSLWEDDETDSRILDAIMDYALTTSGDRESLQGDSKGEQQRGEEEEGHGDSQSQYQTNTHFYSSPYELLMTLDAARRSVQSPSLPNLHACFIQLNGRSSSSAKNGPAFVYSASKYCATQHYAVLYFTVLYCTNLFCAVLCCAVLCCGMLSCTALYCAALS